MGVQGSRHISKTAQETITQEDRAIRDMRLTAIICRLICER